MNTNMIIAVLVALGIGIGGGYMLASATTPASDSMHVMPDGSVMNSGSMHGAMADMMSELDGKTGDEFDKAFLSEMIMHHEGAVDMAEAARLYAKHAELKTMADAIISAQTAEIQQMKEWQTQWYGR